MPVFFRIAAALALVPALAAGCTSPFPDVQALSLDSQRRQELAAGPLRPGLPSAWALQYVSWSGDGPFDSIDPGIGVSLSSRALYGYLPVAAYVVPGAFIALFPGPEFNWPDGETARWLIGGGLVVGAVIESVAAASGSPGGMPYLGIPVAPEWRLFPEAGIDWSRHRTPSGDLDSLRWLAGFRLLPRDNVRTVKPYLRFGWMFSELHLDAAPDSAGSGPYASFGVDWRLASPGSDAEPGQFGAFLEAGGAFLDDSGGDDARLLTLQAGLAFRW
ncbi:MAG: hypothetical protein JW909_03955 [Planctomycetes bacterium]|nr:hypothetical protein [Planctomycetota bacterium]